ncbi:MAG: DUF3187 family protein [Gammaproteobacteria bacterium]|nr:DUF3187 family protein [Gammaproteobacteria bacterium]
MIVRNPVNSFCNRVFYCLLISFLTIAVVRQGFASQIVPFATHNQNPLISIYGLPVPTSADLLPLNESALQLTSNFSNTINNESTTSEILFIDIETHNLNLIYDIAFRKNMMLRLHIPFIKHYEGFMDKWIDDYHDMLNLPDGIRPAFPRDQVAIYYELNGTALINMQQPESGLGDISLQMAFQAVAENNFSLSYWAGIKLPTGDHKKLTGSGHMDFNFWIASSKQLNDSLSIYTNAGMILIQDSYILKPVQKDRVAFLTTGLQYQATEKIQLKAQLDNHSAFYKSATRFLGSVTQLTFGGSILFKHDSELDIAVAEDVKTNASPDVNFNLTWRLRF